MPHANNGISDPEHFFQLGHLILIRIGILVGFTENIITCNDSLEQCMLFYTVMQLDCHSRVCVTLLMGENRGDKKGG